MMGFGEIGDRLTGRAAEREAKEIADTNADFIMDEYEETRRRTIKEFDQMVSYIEGVQATSGFKVGRSTEKLKELARPTEAAAQLRYDQEVRDPWIQEAEEFRDTGNSGRLADATTNILIEQVAAIEPTEEGGQLDFTLGSEFDTEVADLASFEAYRLELAKSFDQELDWMGRSAVSRSNITTLGGEVAAEQAKWGTMTGWFNIGATTAGFFT